MGGSCVSPRCCPCAAPCRPLMAGGIRTPPRPLQRRVEAVRPLFRKTAL